MARFTALVAALAVAAAVLATSAFAQGCNYETVDIPTGRKINFDQLSQIDNLLLPGQDFYAFDSFETDGFENLYIFKLCDRINNNTFEPCVADTAFCLVDDFTGNAPNPVKLGSYLYRSISDYPGSDPSKGVFIEYTGGDACVGDVDPTAKHRVYVTLECDPRAPPEIPFETIIINNDGAKSCEHKVFMSSRHACPNITTGVCETITDCTSCVQQTECGWCSLTQTCTDGDSFGPNAGSCRGEYWHTTANPCVDCDLIKGCVQCSSQPDCQFCGDMNMCQGLNGIAICINPKVCTCPVCSAGQYCPDDGGECINLPNVAGLFIGGMVLGLGLCAIGGGIYWWWKKRQSSYTGLA